MNGVGASSADGVDEGTARVVESEPGEEELEPEEPEGWVDISFEHPREDAVERFRTIFTNHGIPAVFWRTGLGDWLRIDARIMFGRGGELLRWSGVPGREWAPMSVEEVNAVVDSLGVTVQLGDLEREPAEPLAATPTGVRRLVDAMVMCARESSVTADLIAREAKAPVVLNRFGDWMIISPFGEPRAVEASSVWGMPDVIVLWRQGDERGTSTFRRGDQHGHAWGFEAEFLDPSNPWHRDHTGKTVAEWLEATRPEPPEWEPWAKVAALDDDSAQRLRLALRRPDSDEQTFPRFADALGLPAVVVDLLDHDLDPMSLPGAEVVRPAGFLRGVWEAIRRDVRNVAAERNEPKPSRPPAKLPALTVWWLRVTCTRPWWYHLLALGAIGIFGTLLVVRLQEDGSLWAPAVGLFLALADYSIPRRMFAADLFPDTDDEGGPRQSDK
ncbi:hypothetical protein ACFFGH_11735 [Lysobacter korlensis]|uniref:Uncharacterized protein n=1 Tax=Lysobacter korlensis TaxID=553636 RepID=A0ABV6RNE6_9GAMM